MKKNKTKTGIVKESVNHQKDNQTVKKGINLITSVYYNTKKINKQYTFY